MNISLEEIKGMERQRELLVGKVNKIREGLAVEIDPSTQVKLEFDLERTEAEIRVLKNQLAERFNFRTSEGKTVLYEKVKSLNIEEQMGELHLVNCNRKNMTKRFWYEFDEREEERFQYYFISACPTQMPPSFSEKLIYELIIDELEDNLEAIHCRRKESSNRIKIFDLPVGRNLKSCRSKFQKFFSQYFEFKTDENLDHFIKTGLPEMEYSFVTMVFEIHERDWKDCLPEYFQWIIDTFSHTHRNVPKFLFFFVVYQNDLHMTTTNIAAEEIQEPLQKICADHKSAVLLSPLLPVPISDLQAWMMKLGEANPAKIEEVIGAMAKGLQGKVKEQYLNKKELNMCDIELLQELVFQVANET